MKVNKLINRVSDKKKKRSSVVLMDLCRIDISCPFSDFT